MEILASVIRVLVLFFSCESYPCSVLGRKKSINLARLFLSTNGYFETFGQWFIKSVKTNTYVCLFFICKNRSEISQTYLELNKLGSWHLK